MNAQADRKRLARDAYRAYETGDRELIESLMSEDLVFFSPPDPGIDRARYFEACWPNAGQIESFEVARITQVEVYFGWDLS